MQIYFVVFGTYKVELHNKKTIETVNKNTVMTAATFQTSMGQNDTPDSIQTDIEIETESKCKWKICKNVNRQRTSRKLDSSLETETEMKLKLPKKQSKQTETRWLEDMQIANRSKVLRSTAEYQRKETSTSTSRPPPVFIEAQNINPLLETLSQSVGPNAFVIKQMKNSQAKLQTYTSEDWRKIVSVLRTKNASYHTYQVKQEKDYRIVIKGLHPKINVGRIEQELSKAGHILQRVS